MSGFLLDRGCDIVDNVQFGDRAEDHFFMRVDVIRLCEPSRALEELDELRRDFA